MGTTTISLERSAYDLLRSQKHANESFSEEIHRLLGPHPAKLREFATMFSAEDGARIAEAMEELRAEDLEFERRKSHPQRESRGRRR